MATWKKVLVSGSAIEVRNITASNLPESTAGSDKLVVIDTATGRLAYTSSGAGGGGIFTNQGNYYDTGNTLKVTGSTLLSAPAANNIIATQSAARYAFLVSESAHFYNHNVGYPTSNAWKTSLEGSYFNNFDSNTDVSEILRFVAGLLSSSAASPLPNTRAIDQFTATENNKTTVTLGESSNFPAGNIPIGHTDPHIQYIIDKGFTSTGSQLFGLVTSTTKIKSNNYYITYATDTNDSTSNSSDGGTDPQLIGFGGIGAPAVAIKLTQNIFFDNDGTSWTLIDSTTTGSSHFFRNSNPDTTAEGITLNTIPTAQPTVIPAAFIDGKATGLASNNGASVLFNSNGLNPEGVSSASISSSGFYNVRDNWTVYTGSQESSAALTRVNDNEKTIFYIPVGKTGHADGDVFSTLTSQLSTGISFGTDEVTSGSFTSRSLSGAPYLNGAQYTFSTSASNAFYPLYTADSTITSEGVTDNFTSSPSTNGSDISNITDFERSGWTAATQNAAGVINSAGVVYNGGTDQNGSVPNINSVIHLKKTETLDFGGNFTGGDKTNTTLTTSDATSDTFNATFTVQIINSSGAENESTKTFTQRPHLAGHFGQPASSGSMLLFGSADGQDESDTQVNNQDEKFLGEKYRRAISDCATAGDLENAFDSGSALSKSSPRDAQVKPGYLVIPGSSFGYWYPSSYYNSANYYWYLREFDFGTPGSQGSLTVTITGAQSTPSSLTALTDTSTADSLSIGIIFESGIGAGSGGNTEVIDLTRPGSATTGIATGDSNPFSSDINVKGWVGGSAYSSNSSQIILSDPANLILNNTNNKVWALVRLRGTALSSNGLENIQISYSA